MNICSLTKPLLIALFSGSLIACGGGGGGGGDDAPAQTQSSQPQTSTEASSTANTPDSNTSTTETNTSTETPAPTPPAQPENTEENNPPPEEVAETTEEDPVPEEEVEEEPDFKSVTLSWTAPSTRKNGSALDLSEISGYAIYFFMDGSDDGEGEALIVDGATNNSLTIDKLTPGTYYFAIATIDINGLYSDTSDYVEANID